MIERHSSYKPENTMRELIRDNNLLLMTFSRFDIPFGFGDGSVSHVCREQNVDLDTFLTVCNLLSGREYEGYKISLHALMNYLKNAHTSFVTVSLPKLRHKLIEAINYSESNDVALLFIKFFDDYVAEVHEHLNYENDVVFGYVEKLLLGEKDKNYSIAQFSTDHVHMGEKLNELKDIFIYHYSEGANALLSSALFDIINLERDLMSHFEIESRLFVPEVEKLEKSLVVRRKEKPKASDDRTGVDMLGEREKEIICCVAKGMSNKEIADKLYLSVHTVATHRKNISAKLEIHSSAGLAIFAILHHLVDIKDLNPHGK